MKKFGLNAPDFWRHGHTSLWGEILTPVSDLYNFLAMLRLRLAKMPQKMGAPVICVGNATLGGAGKTPVCRFLAQELKNQGLCRNPCVVMRGYRGSQSGPLLVTPTHTTADIGDEAIMQYRHVPVVVSKNRQAGVRYAQKLGFDLILTDDGLQTPGFFKDFTLLVVDGPYGFGNGRVFPAGPLRLNPTKTLSMVDAVCVIGGGSWHLDYQEKPLFMAKIIGDRAPFPNKPVIAFAGLGRPEKFRETLDTLNQPIQKFFAFPDHHQYQESELHSLSAYNRPLLTTEKDWVRLPADWQKKINYLPVNLTMSRAAELCDLIKTKANLRAA